MPRPRLHLIRFHGVLAPARMGWARLLKRVFEFDLESSRQRFRNRADDPAWLALVRTGQMAPK